MAVHCWHVRLIGEPAIWHDRQQWTGRGRYRKSWFLLARLLLSEATVHSRETLAAWLWPGLPQAAALTNLRQLLQDVARFCPPSPHGPRLQVTRRSVALQLQPDDVADVHCWMARQWQDGVPFAFQPGVLLDGMALEDDDGWWAVEIAAWPRVIALGLQHRCLLFSDAGLWPQAVLVARQWWTHSPLDEQAARTLAKLLRQQGDRRGADAVLAEWAAHCRHELGTAPVIQDPEVLGPEACVPGLPAQVFSEKHHLVMLAVQLAPDRQADDQLSTLLAIRQMLQAWQAEGCVLTGFTLLAGFGGSGGDDRASERALAAALQICRLFAGLTCQGVVSGEVVYRTDAHGLGWFGALPITALSLAAAAQPDEIRASHPLLAADHDWQSDSRAGYSWQAGRQQSPEQAPSLPLRQTELTELNQQWQRVLLGEARWLLLNGAAGMGKTTLCASFAQTCTAAGARVVTVRCQAGQQAMPLSALRQALHTLQQQDIECAAAIASQEDGGEVATLLTQFLPDFAGALPGANRSLLFWALFLLLERLAKQRPLLLWVDDLHWADAALLECLAYLAGLFEAQRVMLLCTSRPDTPLVFAANAPQRLELAALPDSDIMRLIRYWDPEAQLDSEQIVTLVRRSAGVPLFAEWLARQACAGSHLPESLHKLPAMELDRLGAYRFILQAAAVLGDRFSLTDLMILLPDEGVQSLLALAVFYRLIVSEGHEQYAFRHALIRDAAYAALSDGVRRQYHRQIALHWEELPTVSPAVIAGHFEAAQVWARAIRWWQRAGGQALAGHFATDAKHSLAHACQLAEEHGMDDAEAVALQLALAQANLLADGYGSAAGYQLFQRVYLQVADIPAQRELAFRALSGMYMGASSQQAGQGLRLARQLAAEADDDAKQLMACFALGNSLFWQGEFTEAWQWQQRGLALAERLPFGERSRYWGEDLAVLLAAFASWNAWFLGRQGRPIQQQGLALARQRSQPHTLCFMLAFTAAAAWSADDAAACAHWAEEGLQIATRHDFPLWQGIHGLFGLWAQARSGCLQEVSAAHRAAEQFGAAYQAGMTTAVMVLSSLLQELGLRDELAQLLPLFQQCVGRGEDAYALAECLWLQGWLCEDATQAGQYYAQSVEVARERQSPALVARLQHRHARLMAVI